MHLFLNWAFSLANLGIWERVNTDAPGSTVRRFVVAWVCIVAMYTVAPQSNDISSCGAAFSCASICIKRVDLVVICL